MIARVIVEVKTYQVNKPFDYHVPLEFQGFLEVGMRVHVPFNHRSLMGIVVELIDETPSMPLKDIIDVLDIEPIISQEFIDLSFYLSKSLACFITSALDLVMPSAYKTQKKTTYIKKDILPLALDALFHNNRLVLDASHTPYLAELKKALKAGLIDEHVELKNKVNIKTKTTYHFHSNAMVLTKRQKEVLDLIASNSPISRVDAIEKGATLGILQKLLALKAIQETQEEVYQELVHPFSFVDKSVQLNADQEAAVYKVLAAKGHETYLLKGVTGSGKTEVYIALIEAQMKQGKEAILLVPEISLTPLLIKRFKARFDKNVAVIHSKLTPQERLSEWRKMKRKEVSIVIGARSAIFAPFENIGIIILDEEHETTYKQDTHVRYHARDVALFRAKYHNVPLILGSATPSVESYYQALSNNYTLLSLPKRAKEASLPEVTIVDMKEELKNNNRLMFSSKLQAGIQDRLAKKEQTILLLNRRGFSNFIMCRACSHVIRCESCDVSLTYHKDKEALTCHYCDHHEAVPTVCPKCESKHIRYVGVGTQQVEDQLRRLFPTARILRMDADTTKTKGAFESMLEAFLNEEADILLGTQMISKGLDFPKVTLVGVLMADMTLNYPDYRASERTFQLISQVSGRAGRSDLKGEVIVQAYDTIHYALSTASRHDYETFYAIEMKMRKIGRYVPFYELLLLRVGSKERNVAYNHALLVAKTLKQALPNASVLGPTEASMFKLKNTYRYDITVKALKADLRLDVFLSLIEAAQSNNKIELFIDKNPFFL